LFMAANTLCAFCVHRLAGNHGLCLELSPM